MLQEMVNECKHCLTESVKQCEAAHLSKPLYLSIIYRIPAKILLHIFRYTSSSIEDNIFGIGHIWESTAYALSAVCRQWQEITLIMPELWTSLEVDLRNGDQMHPAVALMLKHSKDVPVSFYVTAPPGNYGSWIGFNNEDKDKESPAYKARCRQDKVQWELMDLVAENNDQWCSFNIDTVHEAVHESVDYTFSVSEDDKRADLPPFHRLECATIDMFHYGAPTIYKTVMKYAPNLSTLTLKYDIKVMDEYLEILPQIAKIRHLILKASMIDLPWTDLLCSCPHLKSFVYQGDKHHGRLLDSCNHPIYQKPDQSEPPVECKELGSISIDLACLDYHGQPNYDLLSSLFTTIKVPLLQSLTMYAEDPHFDTSIFTWPCEIIISFISAIRLGKLTALSLKDLPVDASDLLVLLELTAFLEELVESRLPDIWTVVLGPIYASIVSL
ncbi:hypothetical protein PM082_002240 [Marasmius tenuissimus]|nr:hypothetical protein PM082_002240 [Marasmius tenuissimus]